MTLYIGLKYKRKKRNDMQNDRWIMTTEIDRFVQRHCDFCDYENSKPCLSCTKIIMFLAFKEVYELKSNAIDEELD